MSNRLTAQDGGRTPESRKTPDFSKFNIHDSFRISHTDTPVPQGAGEERRRLSRQQLEEIADALGERDKQIVIAIQRYRYLITSQIRRLYFTDAVTPSAGLRATARSLKRLRELGLIDHLARRIGGVRAGSGALVWYVTHAGERLLRLHDHDPAPVKTRFFEPSPYFLSHTLAVADIAVQLTELCRNNSGTELAALQPEPECWRTYSEYGAALTLKPDLYAVTVSGQYEDRWFFEIDLDTESPAKVLEKCERYHRYYRTGLEQEESGVFPLTVWIVPTAGRKERLLACLRDAFDKQPRLFAVVTQNELEHLVLHGGDEEALC